MSPKVRSSKLLYVLTSTRKNWVYHRFSKRKYNRPLVKVIEKLRKNFLVKISSSRSPLGEFEEVSARGLKDNVTLDFVDVFITSITNDPLLKVKGVRYMGQ